MEWKTKDATFVSTNAAQFILRGIKKYQVVVVEGPSGIGKSFTARHVTLALQREGFEIRPITDAEDIINNEQKETKQVFLIEDVMGQCYSKLSILEHWQDNEQNLLSTLRRCSNIKLVFTIRSNIYKHLMVMKLLKHFGAVGFKMSSDELSLSPKERRIIWHSYVKDIKLDEIGEDTVSKYPYLPLLCHLYTQRKDKSDKRAMHDLFKEPFQAV